MKITKIKKDIKQEEKREVVLKIRGGELIILNKALYLRQCRRQQILRFARDDRSIPIITGLFPVPACSIHAIVHNQANNK